MPLAEQPAISRYFNKVYYGRVRPYPDASNRSSLKWFFVPSPWPMKALHEVSEHSKNLPALPSTRHHGNPSLMILGEKHLPPGRRYLQVIGEYKVIPKNIVTYVCCGWCSVSGTRNFIWLSSLSIYLQTN